MTASKGIFFQFNNIENVYFCNVTPHHDRRSKVLLFHYWHLTGRYFASLCTFCYCCIMYTLLYTNNYINLNSTMIKLCIHIVQAIALYLIYYIIM